MAGAVFLVIPFLIALFALGMVILGSLYLATNAFFNARSLFRRHKLDFPQKVLSSAIILLFIISVSYRLIVFGLMEGSYHVLHLASYISCLSLRTWTKSKKYTGHYLLDAGICAPHCWNHYW